MNKENLFDYKNNLPVPESQQNHKYILISVYLIINILILVILLLNLLFMNNWYVYKYDFNYDDGTETRTITIKYSTWELKKEFVPNEENEKWEDSEYSVTKTDLPNGMQQTISITTIIFIFGILWGIGYIIFGFFSFGNRNVKATGVIGIISAISLILSTIFMWYSLQKKWGDSYLYPDNGPWASFWGVESDAYWGPTLKWYIILLSGIILLITSFLLLTTIKKQNNKDIDLHNINVPRENNILKKYKFYTRSIINSYKETNNCTDLNDNCIGCNGKGIQILNNGERIICSICKGKGKNEIIDKGG